MSKIIFWSPYHGQGQTSNIHATAFIMSLLHKKRVLMMQTHFNKNNLELPLVGQMLHENDKRELFCDIGLDVAVTYSNMNKLNGKMLESCCLTFSNTSLLLLSGTETKNRETFDRDIGKSLTNVIKDADACVDVVLIDSNSGNDELSFRIMPIADLIVINLTQRRYVLDHFFNDYGEHFSNNNKVFYLFGDYDDNSSFNINNCRQKYKQYIKSYNSGVIPYCTNYMDAQNECDVVNFMWEGLCMKGAGKTNPLYYLIKKVFRNGKYDQGETEYFFHRSKLAVEKIFNLLSIPIRKDHREEGKYVLK